MCARAYTRAPPAASDRAAFVNDIFKFDPHLESWTKFKPSGPLPTSREFMGFTAALDGMLYVFAGLCCSTKNASTG